MNTKEPLIIPFYAKFTIFLIGIFVLFAMLYITKSIVLPLVFAIIIAILLQPVVNFITRKGINRILAISISLVLTMIVIGAFGAFIISQLSRLSDSWPLLVDKFTGTLNEIIAAAGDYYEIDPVKIHAWVAKTQGELINTSSAAIGATLSTIGGLLVAVFLVPVYVFLILFYEPLILDFIRKLFGESHQSEVGSVVSKTKTVVQRYLMGLVIEAAIIAGLEATALFLLGIEYAILLGILGALLNTIPYLGGLVAVALPMMVAIVTKSSGWYAIYILIIYYVIQLIDNNYIVPKIVASKVKINALFSIIVVIAGNALWGIPGMFLSIPLLAIVKLIFDHVEGLKPWGFLLGDTMPGLLDLPPIITKIIKKPKVDKED
jgi:predicted PurR-regulated permease PerM